MNAWAEDQPRIASRGSVYSLARRVREEMQIAMELAMDGPKCDVTRAMDHLDKARALLGQGGGDR